MKDEDVRIGMKVVPHDKTAEGWGSLASSEVWNEAQQKHEPFLLVENKDINVHDKKTVWSLGTIGQGGDLFNASDFEPYLEASDVMTQFVVAAALPTRITYWHDSYELAEAEARRLCLKEGQSFHVLEVAAVVKPAEPTIIRKGD